MFECEQCHHLCLRKDKRGGDGELAAWSLNRRRVPTVYNIPSSDGRQGHLSVTKKAQGMEARALVGQIIMHRRPKHDAIFGEGESLPVVAKRAEWQGKKGPC